MENQNINTLNYWERRFSTGDWELKHGRSQTEHFAKSQVNLLKIDAAFEGAILDFGCGLGDAIPVYHAHFPKASLWGLDISPHAIKMCKEKYGDLATFIQGDYTNVPDVDIIISSNVFEHLTNDKQIVRFLLDKCHDLYITVPYKEWPLFPEHVNTYDESSFSDPPPAGYQIFYCKGWSQYGLSLFIHIYLMNILRGMIGKPLLKRSRQIIYHFLGKKST